LFQAINKILDGTQKFKSLVDAGLKFDTSGYGAIAWSVLSFGLQIAINGKEVREFVFQSSEAITQLIARYAGYEILYRGSTKPSDACRKFEERLVDVYKAILVYMGTLEGYLQDGVLRKFLVFSLAHRTDCWQSSPSSKSVPSSCRTNHLYQQKINR
jgi:hypothetical protein